MRMHTLAWVGLTLFFPSQAAADGPAPGFDFDPLPFAPPLFGTSATLGGGDIVTFDGIVIERVTSEGLPVATYETLTSFAFPSFVVVAPDESFAVVGENSTGMLFRVDLALGGAVPLASIDFNYDAAIDSAGSIYVSAPAASPGMNELLRVHPVTGAVEVVARVSGFSGPVALDGLGNLFLGIAEAPNRVVRYSPAQLAGGSILGEADGVLVTSGWSGISHLVVDHETRGLFVVENDFVAFVEPTTVYRALADKTLSQPVFVAPAFHSFGKLEIVTDPSHPAVFVAFQPEAGGRLTVPVTDFASLSERISVHPRRPTVHVSGPGVGPGTSGIIEYTVEGASPGGAILLGFGLASSFDPAETAYIIHRDIPPIFWGLDPDTHRFVHFRLPVDQDGKATFVLFNPGFFGAFVALQSALTDAQLDILGSAPGIVL